MNKQKVLIVSIISLLTVLAAVLVVFAVSGKYDDFKSYFNNGSSVIDDDSDYESTDTDIEDNTTETLVNKEKMVMPNSPVAVVCNAEDIFDNDRIVSLSDFGFNTVIVNYSSENRNSIKSALVHATENEIYSGVIADYEDADSVFDFVKENNLDFIIFNLKENKTDAFTDTSNKLKVSDSQLKIGLSPVSSDSDLIKYSELSSEGSADFIFFRQGDLSISDFRKSLENMNSVAGNIWACFNLSDIKKYDTEQAKNFVGAIKETTDNELCELIAFDSFLNVKNATSAVAKYVVDFIKTQENALMDKDFSVTNYKKTEITVDESNINFRGTSSPLYPLLCNGKKINVAYNGDFSIDFKLTTGKNKIVFNHKDKDYTYIVTYRIETIKSVSPTKSVKVPGGMEVEVEAKAIKNASISVKFNGQSYTMKESGSSEKDENSKLDSDSDFTVYSAVLKMPEGKSTEQNLGKFEVFAKYNGQVESMKGASITVSANEILIPEVTETSAVTTTTTSLPKTSVESTAEKPTATTATTAVTVSKSEISTETSESSTDSEETKTEIDESTTEETTPDVKSGLQRYYFTENYGLGTATICEIIDDYVETYSGTNTSTYSDPEYSPLLKGTSDYIKTSATLDDSTYYYLSSGVKVPLQREENTSSGSKSTITHLRVTSGYIMPSNSIEILSCSNSGNKTIIKLGMNRNVPFNAKLLGQSYHEYKNGRMVSVNGVDCSGLQFSFSDTTKMTGNLSFMNSVVSSASYNVEGNRTVLTFKFGSSGKFYGFHYEYDSNNNLVIVIKNKPQSLSGYTIMLDPGHGGYDPGASCCVSGGVWSEKKINLSLALKIKEKLEAEGVRVIMTRSEDSFVSLSNRNMLARRQLPDLFISVHCDSSNSSSSYGTSAYYYRAYSQPLAKYVHQSIVDAYNNIIYSGKGMSNTDRGASFYAFKVSRIEECPSILVEYGFVSNTTECQVLQNSDYQSVLATATVNGIKNYISNV